MKPADLFLGVVDVFAILLPGSLLTFAARGWLMLDPDRARMLRPLPDHGVEGWACFGIAAYVLGHALHFLGGLVFDPFYDGVYKQRRRAELGQDARARFRARIAAHQRLGANYRERDNILTWSLAWLRLSSPAAISELDRLEADSKFFRSLATALIVSWPMVFAWFARNDRLVGLAWLELLVLPGLWSFARYGKYESGDLRTRVAEIIAAKKFNHPLPGRRKLEGSWLWLWHKLRRGKRPEMPHGAEPSPDAGAEDLYVYAEALAAHDFIGDFTRPAFFLFFLWIIFIGVSVWLWSDWDGARVSAVFVLLILFAVFRYMKLRLERTTKAYEFFVADPLMAGPAKAAQATPP